MGHEVRVRWIGGTPDSGLSAAMTETQSVHSVRTGVCESRRGLQNANRSTRPGCVCYYQVRGETQSFRSRVTGEGITENVSGTSDVCRLCDMEVEL